MNGSLRHTTLAPPVSPDTTSAAPSPVTSPAATPLSAVTPTGPGNAMRSWRVPSPAPNAMLSGPRPSPAATSGIVSASKSPTAMPPTVADPPGLGRLDGAADVVSGDTGGASVVWRNEPFILTSTGVLDFGAVTAGLRSAPQALVVGNDGGAPLRVSAATVLGDRFAKAGDSCTGASVRAGAVCSVAAQYAPLAAVQDGGAIQVSSNDPDGDRFAALTGRGATPPATPQPAPATASRTAPPAAPRAVTAAQASSATTRAVVAALRRLGLAGLAAGRTVKVAVKAPAGRVAVEVRQTATDRGRAPVVVVAKGSLRLVAPARRTVTVRPTAAGRRSARRARRITAVVRTVFTPARGRAASARSTVTLRRG